LPREAGSKRRLDCPVLWYEQNNGIGYMLPRASPTARLSERLGSSLTLVLAAGAENTTARSETIEAKTRCSFIPRLLLFWLR
jgi:hypothetical protein